MCEMLVSLLPVLSMLGRDHAPISGRSTHNTSGISGGHSRCQRDFVSSVSSQETSSPCAKFEPMSQRYWRGLVIKKIMLAVARVAAAVQVQ